MIYLASPYRHDDPEIMRQRLQAAVDVTRKLIRQGITVFSPIAYSVHLSQAPGENQIGDLDRDLWLRFDLAVLSLCSELWILGIDGWETSGGVMREIAEADRLHLPIFMFMPYEPNGLTIRYNRNWKLLPRGEKQAKEPGA